MAIYFSIPKSVPSNQRTTLITEVEDGDQIDLTEILGRPAKRIRFFLSSSDDKVECRINNLEKIFKRPDNPFKNQTIYNGLGVNEDGPVETWHHNSKYPVITFEGGETIDSLEGLSIASIEIDTLTLNTGTTISMQIW